MLRHLILPLVFLHALHAEDAADSRLTSSSTVPGASTLPDLALKVESGPQTAVVSPTALAFDSKGNVLVTETHRFANAVVDDRLYPEWYLDDLAALTTNDRLALHQKWSKRLPLETLTAKSEVIKLLSDTNGDGTPDESKVYAEGFNQILDGTLAGVFELEGTVYVACIPKLLMLRDTDGDGVADQRETIADGFGVRISLSGHDLNGFALGPDGRIYGTIGDRGFSITTREGVKYDYPNQGAAFRFEPDGSGFELLHTGLRNPKEIAFDDLGNPFTVDNNSDQGDKARIVYLVEGGDSGWEMEHQTMFSFHRQIGLEKLPPNRWMAERIWEPKNPEHPAFIVPPSANLSNGPSGLTYHPGTGFLESEAGRFMICDYRGTPTISGILSFSMSPDGAGMKLEDSRQILRGVAATDAEFSLDGRLLVTDFGGGWKAHAGGRLLSLSAGEKSWRANEAKGTARLFSKGFEQRGAAELSFLLRHPDSRVRLRAQLALTRKPEGLEMLTEAAVSTERQVRMHGIWGLGILARRGPAALPGADFAAIPSSKVRSAASEKLASLLTDNDDEVRAQSLRAIADVPGFIPTIPLAALLEDPSPRVRFFAAIFAGKQNQQGSFDAICKMIDDNADRDPFLRHAGAFALGKISIDPGMFRVMTTHPSVHVRLATVVALRRMKGEHLAEFLFDQEPQVVDEAIRAICDLDLVAQRPSVAGLMDNLSQRSWSPIMLRRLIHNAYRCGGSENAQRLLTFASDEKQPAALRSEAFRLLDLWTEPFPADQFTGHWRPLPKRDSNELTSVLTNGLPPLLKSSGSTLGYALSLAKKYQPDLPGLENSALQEILKNPKLPIRARSTALEIIISRNPSDLGPILSSLVTDPSDSLAFAALEKLVADGDIGSLSSVLDSGRPSLQRQAWKLATKTADPNIDQLFVKALAELQGAKGIGEHALELMDAARERQSPSVSKALENLENSLKSDPDPLTIWNPALTGGDPRAGRSIFHSHPAGECGRCHQVGQGHDAGQLTAPNLSGVAARSKDRRQLLESLVSPAAKIAPGFGSVSITFHSGASITGILSADTPEHIDLEYNGRLVRVERSDIASASESVSAMPPMASLLKPAEIRDLVAWLSTLTDELKQPVPTASPEPFDPATLVSTQPPAPSGIDPKIIANGKAQYIVCGACHGQNGEGTPIGPPIAGSEWVTGPVENLIRIQLRGLEGPITVKGVTYDIPGGMAPLAFQDDNQISAVLTYIRNSFGNSASAVTPAEVAALRSEVGKPKLRASDLIPPLAEAKVSTPSPELTVQAPAQTSGKYDKLQTSSSTPRWLLAFGLLIAGVVTVLLLKRRSA